MHGELSNSHTRGSLNVQRAPQRTLRHPHRSKLPWLRAFLLEAQSSDLAASIFKKSQNRNKRAGGRKGIIQLLLIVLGAIAVVVLGLYGASPRHTTTSTDGEVTQNTSRLCRKMTWHGQTGIGQASGGVKRLEFSCVFDTAVVLNIHTWLGTLSLRLFDALV